MEHNAGSPEGNSIVTTLKEKSGKFSATATDRGLFGLKNMGSVLCDTRGKLSPRIPPPHPDLPKGTRFKGARQPVTALSSSNAV